MSHVSVFKTKIVNPNPSLVFQTMQALAQLYNAKILTQSFRDRYDVINADYILVMPNGRGVGVGIKGGELEVVGDPYGWGEQFEKLQQQIIQTYVHFALLQQLQKMGYNLASIQQLENGAIVGEVVRL